MVSWPVLGEGPVEVSEVNLRKTRLDPIDKTVNTQPLAVCRSDGVEIELGIDVQIPKLDQVDPVPAEKADTRIAGKVFAENAAEAGVNFVGLTCHCLDVAYYNTMVQHVRNKAQVLFVTTTQLMQALLDWFPDQDVHILIDRQGGRVHYREHLLRSFPEMELRIILESEQRSAYELRSRSRVVQLSFEVGADERHFAVSLASMVSKYVRELLMERVNRYFAKMSPDLKPTAGYWKDGLRFLEDVQTQLPDFAIDRHRLVRSR